MVPAALFLFLSRVEQSRISGEVWHDIAPIYIHMTKEDASNP